MYTLIVQNKYGEQLELTHNPAYDITNIDGIDPPDANINTTRNAGADGSVFNSAYMNNRTITITLSINAPAEVNRINLYQYFKSRFPVTLYYSNASRNVYINGYVQSMTINFFNKKQTAQIVIQCPQPLFNGDNVSIQEFASVESLFEFPFSIEETETPTGGNALTMPYYDSSKTVNGITFTVNNDGTVTANGTATGTASFNLKIRSGASPFTLNAGDYHLSGCPEGGSLTTYRIGANYTNSDNEGVFFGADSGEGLDFTVENDNTPVGCFINIYSGTTVDNLVFSPEIVPIEIVVEGIEFSSLSTYVEKSIVNNGDIDTGCVITIKALGQVVTPKIYNVETTESFILNVTLAAGDEITINTRRAEKSVTLLSNGVTTNIVGSLAEGSTWFQLEPGDNVFTIDAESLAENMLVTFTVIDQYEGV